jgi:hypothetical protein
MQVNVSFGDTASSGSDPGGGGIRFVCATARIIFCCPTSLDAGRFVKRISFRTFSFSKACLLPMSLSVSSRMPLLETATERERDTFRIFRSSIVGKALAK